MNERGFGLSDRLYLNKNIQAFLRVIRQGESSQEPEAYTMLVGGKQFKSMDAHPEILIKVRLGGRDIYSTAAGAYQFIRPTWKECVAALSLRNFSVQSQDVAAVYLIERRRALLHVERGDLDAACELLKFEWASLPGDAYKQGGMKMATVKRVFKKYGGVSCGH